MSSAALESTPERRGRTRQRITEPIQLPRTTTSRLSTCIPSARADTRQSRKESCEAREVTRRPDKIRAMRILRLLALLLLSIGLSALAAVEERGSSPWPTANHFPIPVASAAPAGKPVWVDAELPVAFNPDSVRVIAADAPGPVIPAKTNWQQPNARISWLSTGASRYHVYFDTGANGETQRLAAPAMVGVGDRVTYGKAGVRNRLGVGLWAHPAPVDMDRDGNLDLIVSCPDNPFNGIWYFRNLGTNANPLFDRALWLGPAKR